MTNDEKFRTGNVSVLERECTITSTNQRGQLRLSNKVCFSFQRYTHSLCNKYKRKDWVIRLNYALHTWKLCCRHLRIAGFAHILALLQFRFEPISLGPPTKFDHLRGTCRPERKISIRKVRCKWPLLPSVIFLKAGRLAVSRIFWFPHSFSSSLFLIPSCSFSALNVWNYRRYFYKEC